MGRIFPLWPPNFSIITLSSSSLISFYPRPIKVSCIRWMHLIENLAQFITLWHADRSFIFTASNENWKYLSKSLSILPFIPQWNIMLGFCPSKECILFKLYSTKTEAKFLSGVSPVFSSFRFGLARKFCSFIIIIKFTCVTS